MKIVAKISVQFDCKTCGEKCETESDYIWIDETKIFHCDFCGAKTRFELVPVEEKESSDE